MAIIFVGPPPNPYATIATAMAHALAGDVIQLANGYINETVTVTKNNLTINGGGSSTGIVLHLASDQRLSTGFNFYSHWWTEWLMNDLQSYILRIIKARAELAV